MFKRFRSRRTDEETRLRNRETFLNRSDLIWPVFLVAGKGRKEGITTMKDVFRYSPDVLLDELRPLIPRGLSSVLLFGVPEDKGIEQAFDGDGLVPAAVRAVKAGFPKLEVITDVCLCSYTEDGHCHVGDNDRTCGVLARIALAHARAGADIVAPSDMMDGRVHVINKALKENGLSKVKILSYAAKYASSFYGPFRSAAECEPKSGDRKTYQMDYANSREAMEEIEADIEEGAAQIMLKPALSYLDIVAKARERFKVPLVAYNVSGEYQMLASAVSAGIAKPEIIEEVLVSIKRAGADRIATYFTPYMLQKTGSWPAKAREARSWPPQK